jgi:hypothetical protein
VRRVDLMRGGDAICLQIHTGKKGTRIFLSEDQAAHLAHRLMSFSAGNSASELSVVEEDEYYE